MNGHIKSNQLSMKAMKTSSAPLFFRPLNTIAQNLDLSFSPTHMLRTYPAIQIDANDNIYHFLRDLSFAANMVLDGVQKYHGIDGLQRPLFPLFGNGQV